MSRYANRQEIADKADYEGGLADFVFGYGLSLEDLPEDDPELHAAVAELLKAKPALDQLSMLLPEPGSDDDDG